MHLLLDTSKLSLPTQCHFVIYQVFPVVWGSGLEVHVHSDLPDLVLSLLDLLLMIPASPAAMMSSAFFCCNGAFCFCCDDVDDSCCM